MYFKFVFVVVKSTKAVSYFNKFVFKLEAGWLFRAFTTLRRQTTQIASQLLVRQLPPESGLPLTNVS